MKTLKSGIKVDAAKYYKLLEWKDINLLAFQSWASDNNTEPSINRLSLKDYNKLLEYTKI